MRTLLGRDRARGLALRMLLVLAPFIGCDAEESASPGSVARELTRQVRSRLRTEGKTSVLINLEVPAGDTLASARQRVLASLGADFKTRFVYDNVPALAGVLDEDGLERLGSLPSVASVQLDEPGAGHLTETVPLLKADVVHKAYSWTGKTVRVAVLDSGVDTDHPDLMDDLVAQQCFSGDCPPGDTAQGTSAEDEFGHGTTITGVITSKGTISPAGIAPDAEIVAVRVLNSSNLGGPSQWIAGLDWVLTNLATLKVRVINMSLGVWSSYPGKCDAQYPALASVISQLVAKGVVLFSSTGNYALSTGIDAPACISGVIAVGATYDSDLGRQPPTGSYPAPANCFDQTSGPGVIACFTNSGPEMDLVAPGVKITSTAMGGNKVTSTGTSVAAPVAAGVAALLLDCNPALTPAEVETALKQSGALVTDPRNNLKFATIDALAAVNKVCVCGGKPDGTPCDDGDPCTKPDACKAGLCYGTPVICAPSDSCHLAGSCDKLTGACSSPLKPAGAGCDDGNPCTKQDVCDASGKCAGAAYSCAPTPPCEAASSCDGKGGCTPTFKPKGAPCDDGQACTKNDQCDAGKCAGSAYSCTPGPCESASTCDGKGCAATPKPDGTSCDDGDLCTRADGCKAGLCLGSDPVQCPATDECHEVGACAPATGTCSNPPKADGTACSSGACVSGTCRALPEAGVPDARPPVGDSTASRDGRAGDSSVSPGDPGCGCVIDGHREGGLLTPLLVLAAFGLTLARTRGARRMGSATRRPGAASR
jgi:hypothetical protein